MEEKNMSYWISLAHAKDMTNKRKVDFLIEVVYNKGITIEDAFIELGNGNKLGFDFSEKEWAGMLEAIIALPNYSFLISELSEKGVDLIHIMSSEYPKTLKKNLKKDAPILLYVKGNKALLNCDSMAIVGARESGNTALVFTDNIAKQAVLKNYVVVSGFAKGVDKQALDSALNYKGSSIIVLPQGIFTYSTKKYHKEIVSGNLLILSTYYPKVPWSVALAMDRNKIIYGLAEYIYAAESNDSGGTWEGVLDGIKRGRTVYVRYPEKGEKNANLELIKRGATPVNMHGVVYAQPKVENQVEEPEVICTI